MSAGAEARNQQHAAMLRPCALAILAVFLAGCGGRSGPPAAFVAAQPALEAALRPGAVAEFRQLPALPFIDITARLDPAANAIAGTQRTWLANTTGAPLFTVALRCPANAPAFKGASLAVTAARWNGEALLPAVVTADGSGLTWTLPRPLAIGASGCLETAFTATCSTGVGFHGLMSRSGERWCLYHWHPELPLWRDGAWQLPAVTGIGDESQAVLAHVAARLTVPAGTQVIAGGSDDARSPASEGWETVAIATPASRNLAVVLAKDLRCQTADAGGVRVRSWHEAAHPGAGARALRVAAASLALYDRTFGSYPWNELDVVETVQGEGVGGMESTGLVLIDGAAYAGSEGVPDETGPEHLAVLMLETATAHEVGHQWWYGIVGNDAFADPWLDESLTNWTGGWAMETLHGGFGRQSSLQTSLMMAAGNAERQRTAMDLPLSGYGNMELYGCVIYGRGTLMYESLRRRLGDERFLAWLRAWQAANRFGIATPATWRAALAQAIGPEESTRFVALWLHGEGLGQRELVAPLLPSAPR